MRRLATHLYFLLGFALSSVFLAYGQHVDSPGLVALGNHHPQWARPANDAGPLPSGLAMENLTLVLSRPAEQEEALRKLLADQQDIASPSYHRWLTPVEMGARFGLSDRDLGALTSWLQTQGLHVNWVSPSRIFVGFGGSAGAVGRALHTELHGYGGSRFSVATEPLVPKELRPAIKAIHGLYTVEDRPQHAVRQMEAESPLATTSNGLHFIVPADFLTIYGNNLELATDAPVAIVGRSRTDFNDFANFALLTGGPFASLTEVIPTAFGGVDPGPALTAPPAAMVSIGDQSEATLDVLRAGSTSAAPLLLVVATAASGGVEADAQYVVQTSPVPAQVMSISFGECESSAGPAAVAFWDTLLQQAAGEGISVMVSSGDSGASGCDADFSTPPATPQPNSPNYICSSSYATCVGGTEFNDRTDPSQYWSASNGGSLASALGYIPEGGWNEPLDSSGKPLVIASGGGVSTVIPTPAWQTGTGVPAARSGRYTPDLAFSSSGHDGYFGCFAAGGGDCVAAANGSFHFVVFSGTSAAAPSMAGITALLDGGLQAAQGNLNPQLYQMASTAPTVFNDVTVSSSGVSTCDLATPSMCNNSVAGPSGLTGGQAGFPVTAGYDQVTGLGSLNIANFINNYPAAPTIAFLTYATDVTFPTQVLGFPEQGGVNVGNSGSATLDPVTVAITGPAAGDFVATNPCQSPIAAKGYCFIPITFTPSAAGMRTATMTVTSANGSNSPRTIALSGAGTTTLYMADLSLFASANPIAVAQSVTMTVYVSQPSGAPIFPTGSVAISFGNYVSPPVAVEAVGPTTIVVPGGSLPVGDDNVTATFTPDSASSSAYTTSSGSTLLTVAAVLNPGFSILGTTVTVVPGATEGNISSLKLTPINGFVGSVVLTAAVTSGPAGAKHPPTFSFGTTSPANIGATSETAALTILTTAPSTTAQRVPSQQISWYASGAVSLGCLLLMGTPKRLRRWRAMLGAVLLFLLVAGGLSACGGGSSGGGGGTVTDPGTTVGNYTITVTGTSGTLTQTGTVSVVVQCLGGC